jgi:hypothetical protein
MLREAILDFSTPVVSWILRKIIGPPRCPHIWKTTGHTDMCAYSLEYRTANMAPRRTCFRCGREEIFLGPEVIGGKQCKWVETPELLKQ